MVVPVNMSFLNPTRTTPTTIWLGLLRLESLNLGRTRSRKDAMFIEEHLSHHLSVSKVT